MSSTGFSPAGACPRCGEHRPTDAGNGLFRCRDCEKVWKPTVLADGGTLIGGLTDEEREAFEDADGGDRLDTIETLVLASISRNPAGALQFHAQQIQAPARMVVDAIEYLVEEEYVVEDPQGPDQALEYAQRTLETYVNYMPTPKGRHQLTVEESLLMDMVQFVRKATDESIPVFRGGDGQ